MSEENKPIFPRSSENSKENTELIQETRQKLQTEELGFGVTLADSGQNVYCVRCGRENSVKGEFCGSCGFSLNNAMEKPPPQLESFKPQFQTPVYGPPPMPYQPVKTTKEIIRELKNTMDSIAKPSASSPINRWIIWIVAFVLFAGILLVAFLAMMK